MQWLRLYHDTPTDPKWRLVAVESGQTVASVLAVWTCMMVNASQAEPRGTLSGWNDRIIGASLDLKGDAVAAIRSAMQGVVLEGDILTGWERRQRSADSSADRVRQYRERLHAGTGRKRTPYDTKEVIERDSGMCVYCGSTENLCVDHMVPIVLGGDHQSDNFACACKKCNSGKAGRTPEQAGYTIISADALARYRGAVERMGINRVTVTPEDITIGTPTEQNVTVNGDGVTVTSEGVTVSPLRAQTTDSDTDQESKKEPPIPPRGEGEPDLFLVDEPAPTVSQVGKRKAGLSDDEIEEKLAKFKATYPKRNHPHTWGGNSGKGANAKFRNQVRKGVNPDLIISAASRFAMAMQDDKLVGTRSVPDALTWLNQERWTEWNNVHHLPSGNGESRAAYVEAMACFGDVGSDEEWKQRVADARMYR